MEEKNVFLPTYFCDYIYCKVRGTTGLWKERKEMAFWGTFTWAFK